MDTNQACSEQRYWKRKHTLSQTQHQQQLQDLQLQLEQQRQMVSDTKEEAIRATEANAAKLKAQLKDL